MPPAVRRLLPKLLLTVALLALASVMYASSGVQRHAATRAADRAATAERLRTGMLDQETGVRGFLPAGQEGFLAPYRSGARRTRSAETKLRRTADGDQATLFALARFTSLRKRWQLDARAVLAARRSDPRRTYDLAGAERRKALMDAMRGTIDQIERRLMVRRDAELQRAALLSTALVVLLTGLIGLFAALLSASAARRRNALAERERRYRREQGEFTAAIQVERSEEGAHDLLRRHLELRVPGARVAVITRNNSDNRLDACTDLSRRPRLAAALTDAEPQSCLAIRLATRHEEGDGSRLLTCEVCGAEGPSICEPLLVGGRVIGSVLLSHPAGAVDDDALRHLDDSVAQSAPVLANLRNLAIAERRAATDVLTGLPNRRAIQDTLLRMTAHASRRVEPLCAITLDLDHFKDINDRFGHDAGDAVLAQVAAALTANVRASDFVGRAGGEEFVVLAPSTGAEGGAVLAETLRAALETEQVPGVARTLTASFGVAAIPEHAGSAEVLLRLADRALYAAKAGGRNRVEIATTVGEVPAPTVPGPVAE